MLLCEAVQVTMAVAIAFAVPVSNSMRTKLLMLKRMGTPWGHGLHYVVADFFSPSCIFCCPPSSKAGRDGHHGRFQVGKVINFTRSLAKAEMVTGWRRSDADNFPDGRLLACTVLRVSVKFRAVDWSGGQSLVTKLLRPRRERASGPILVTK